MGFENTFDGYCVIFAKHATDERKSWFNKELNRVGVTNYTIIEAFATDDNDPALEQYTNKTPAVAKAEISLIRATKKAIDFARSKHWSNLIIFEDDIIFRKQFKTWWSDVENEVKQSNWDILFLYRWAPQLLKENRKKTTLIPIESTLCAHCYAISSNFYSIFQKALDYCITKGSALDMRTFEYLHKHKCRIFATNKNLAGQCGNFQSSIERGFRQKTLGETFRVFPGYFFYALYPIRNLLYRIFFRLRSLLHRL